MKYALKSQEKGIILKPKKNQAWREEKKNLTPSTPSFRLMRVKEGEGVLSPQDQTLFRCGVGILLYLVKHTRLDLANCQEQWTWLITSIGRSY